jgi:octaprenyl-diphosphate synthase
MPVAENGIGYRISEIMWLSRPRLSTRSHRTPEGGCATFFSIMQLLKVYDFIAQELEGVREIFEQELVCDVPAIRDMIEQVGRFRGKLLRPALVLLSGKACGKVNPAHRVIATVAEMVHMATLIHDDVLDEAEHRRRGRTINALHGNESAVILGDMFISHAFHLCSSLDSQFASRLMAATTNTVCEGELMQLYYRGFYELTEEKYLDIISRKTASLIATCCYLGAKVANADETDCQALETYGRNVGIAFQIMDDITDLIGKEEAAGKTLRTDFLKEKLTLPVIHLLSASEQRERAQLQRQLRGKNEDELQQIIDRLKECGSITYSRQRAKEFILTAQQAVPKTLKPETRNMLLELAISILD